jgi:hypothetical protein
MTEPANLTEQERADLVAYLDGELSEDAVRALERKLNLHPGARAEADTLRRTWELLDFLPRPQPSSSFTHRTLERLSPVRADEHRRGRRWRAIGFGLCWMTALWLCGWFGYIGYNWWTPRPPAEREKIQEREWIERLPRKVREDLEKLSPKERAAQVIQLREQERQQRILWLRPLGAAGPARQATHLADFSPEVKKFVEKELLPHLTPEERRQYDSAQGHAPDFALKVKELARHHPVLPPLPSHRPIAHFDDLPDRATVVAGAKVQWEKRSDAWNTLQRVEGRWPEWALTLHSLLSQQQRQQMPPLGASCPPDFSVEVREFIKKTLTQKVTFEEWKELRSLEGKWPDYPQRLLRLAEKHKLDVPGMSLPGVWEW